MRKIITVLFAVSMAALANGCAYVNSAMPSSTAVTGEAWYTRVTTLLPGGIPLSTSVWYCPNPAAGPASCTQATIDGPAAAPAQPAPAPAPAATP